MGCASSKPPDEEDVLPPPPAPEVSQPPPESSEEVPQEARRRSVAHQAPEVDGRKSVTTFDTARVGVLTRHGIAPARGASGVVSKAKINQDRGVVCWPFNGSHNQALLCIFDGHGMQGERVSEWCMNQIPVRLEAARATLAANPPQALSQTIIQMDKTLLSHQTIGPIARGAGTTSNVLYFKAKSLWVACSGDSRAVMGTIKGGKCVAVDLSMDHKPDLPLERKRIEAAGGVVSAAGPRGLPPSRVWVNGRVGLAMSRSLGDGEAKLHGVIPDPEIKEFTLNPAEGKGDGDKFVIAASDGIWEFISSQQACDVVMRHSNATDACAELVNIAETKWREEEGSYRDDITCIIAHLPFLEEHPDDDDENVAVESHMQDIEIDLADSPLPGASPEPRRANANKDSTRDEDEDEGEKFVKRRLSVAQQVDYDDDDDANAA